MRSLMRENESERAELAAAGGGGFRECKQITSNSVSDRLEWEMLGGRDERQRCLCR